MRFTPFDGSFLVIYGSPSARCADFRTFEDVLAFVRCYFRRHPDATIGDSWRDDLSVVQFRITALALEPHDISEHVREVLA